MTNDTEESKRAGAEDKPEQLAIPQIIASEFSKPQLAVIKLLVTHYNETGRTFIIYGSIIELAEKLNIKYDELRQALKILKKKGVAHFKKNELFDFSYELKLDRDFIDKLRYIHLGFTTFENN